MDADLARNAAPIPVSGPLDGEFSINLCHKWKCLEERLLVQKDQAAIRGDAIYENKDVNGKRLSHSKMSIAQKKKWITKIGEHP